MPYEALDYRFDIDTSCDAARRYTERIFAPLAGSGGSQARYRLEFVSDSSDFELTVGDELLNRTAKADVVMQSLIWHVNQQAISSPGGLPVAHAGAVARRERAVVLPAASGGGKTTLVAGLVEAGCNYLTDEAVVVAPDGLARPYPRILTLRPGSQPLFARYAPALPPDEAVFAGDEWRVDPRTLGGDIAGPTEIVAVISPAYDPSAKTELLPVSRAEMLAVLGAAIFNMDRTKLEALAQLIGRWECYRLPMSDLDTARRLVMDVLEAA